MFEHGAERRAGAIDLGAEHAVFRSKGEVIRDLVLASVIVTVALSLLAWAAWPRVAGIAGSVAVFMVYCAIAHFVRPRPNHESLGWGIGWHSELNRSLLQLRLLLLPGRFVVGGLVEGYRYLRTGQLPQDRMLAKLEATYRAAPGPGGRPQRKT